MPILELTSRERSDLRSAAHSLRPVVLIGDNGLTDAVLKEIDRALTAHELIKVRAGGDDREAREAMLANICDQLSCAPVHHLGKILILFRSELGRESKGDIANEAGRPIRRASEPHVPKKLAAAGKTTTSTRARKPTATPKTVKATKPRRAADEMLNDKGHPQRPSTRKTSNPNSHAIPRRAGSALSLRAGARGGLQRARVARGKR